MGMEFMGVDFMGVDFMGVEFMGVEFMGVGPNLSAHQGPPMPRNSRTILWEWILWEWARICQPTKPPHAQKFPDDFMGVDLWEWARICQPTKPPPCPEIPGRICHPKPRCVGVVGVGVGVVGVDVARIESRLCRQKERR